MKYEITLINKNGYSNYNATLTFGDRDAVGVAKKVFELAVTGHYGGIEIKKVSKSEKESTQIVKRRLTMNRNLDGIYYRVKRNGKYENICFSDMTKAEIDIVITNKSAEYWKRIALHLKDRLNTIGEIFDIIGE